jgi:ribosomal protein S4
MAYVIARDWKAGEEKSRVLDTHGWILVLNGGRDLDEGIRILQESVDEAEILEARYHLGEAQLQKKRSEEATEQLTAALNMIEKAKKNKAPYDESLEPRIQRALERAKSSNSAAQAR